MKITRRQLRKFLLESFRTDPSTIGEDYLEVEMLSVIKQTTKTAMIATLHEKTKKYAISLGHSQILPIITAFENISAKKGGSSMEPNPKKDPDGNYSFNSNLRAGQVSLGNQNNYYSGQKSKSIAPRMQNMTKYLSDCYNISKLKQDGDKLEYGCAAIISHLLQGTTVKNLDGSDRGKDVVIDGSDIYFEVKKSDKTEPQTLLSGSPATSKTPNKYFIFITIQRSYVVHSKLFAIANSLTTELIPTGVSVDANKEYNNALLQYSQDYPEMLDLIYQAAQKTPNVERDKIKLANDIFQKVNTSQPATLFLRKIIFLSQMKSLDATGVLLTDQHKQKIQDTVDSDFFTKDSKGNYSFKTIDYINYNRILPILLHLLMISGAHTAAGSGETERFSDIRMDQGQGTAGTWLRTLSDTKSGGTFLKGILGNSNVEKIIQANWILNFLNYPDVPEQQKTNLLNKLETSTAYKQKFDLLKNDPETKKYVALELLRNKSIFSEMIRERNVLNTKSDYSLPDIDPESVNELETKVNELFKMFTNFERKNIDIDQKLMHLFDIDVNDLYNELIKAIPAGYTKLFSSPVPSSSEWPFKEDEDSFSFKATLGSSKNNDSLALESRIYGNILKELLKYTK